MSILKNKYYLHKWGEGECGKRPMLVVSKSFESIKEAYAYLSQNKAKYPGFVPDTGKYILSSGTGVFLAKFV